MSYVRLRDVYVDFPVFDPSRSLRKTLLRAAVGGQIHRGESPSGPITVTALENINLNLENGDRLGLIGHNGAGKSTLLRVMAGSYLPTRGVVERSGRISTLFSAGVGIDADDTGFENIRIGCLYLGIKSRDLNDHVQRIAEFTELGDYLHMPVRTYSAGMTLRLAFAIATAIEPNILLLDEIIGAGDVQFQRKAHQRIEELINQASVLVLASHANEVIRRFCNKGVVLQAGAMQFLGPIDDAIAYYERSIAKS